MEDSGAIVIKKGVPLPPSTRFKPGHKASPLSSVLRMMEIGDCFELPMPEEQSLKNLRSNLYQRAKIAGIRLAVRTVGENGNQVLGVWRTG